jgi:hypothetical protein
MTGSTLAKELPASPSEDGACAQDEEILCGLRHCTLRWTLVCAVDEWVAAMPGNAGAAALSLTMQHFSALAADVRNMSDVLRMPRILDVDVRRRVDLDVAGEGVTSQATKSNSRCL